MFARSENVQSSNAERFPIFQFPENSSSFEERDFEAWSSFPFIYKYDRINLFSRIVRAQPFRMANVFESVLVLWRAKLAFCTFVPIIIKNWKQGKQNKFHLFCGI